MMKEYISPVLNVLCFAPVERLANISFSDLLEAGGFTGSGDAEYRDPASDGTDDLPLEI